MFYNFVKYYSDDQKTLKWKATFKINKDQWAWDTAMMQLVILIIKQFAY